MYCMLAFFTNSKINLYIQYEIYLKKKSINSIIKIKPKT